MYNDLTRFIASSEEIVSDWNKAHAIADHLYRSSEGAVVCLAEACRQQRLPAKQQAADNIAEGNGRFAHYDHSRFLGIANQATTKLAARLEVGALRKTIEKVAADEIIELLVSIDRMTAKLAEVWREKRCSEVF